MCFCECYVVCVFVRVCECYVKREFYVVADVAVVVCACVCACV